MTDEKRIEQFNNLIKDLHVVNTEEQARAIRYGAVPQKYKEQEDIELFTLQEALVKHAIKYDCVIESATGSGKTVVAGQLAKVARKRKVLIITKPDSPKYHFYFTMLNMGFNRMDLVIVDKPEDLLMSGKVYIMHHQQIANDRFFVALTGLIPAYGTVTQKTTTMMIPFEKITRMENVKKKAEYPSKEDIESFEILGMDYPFEPDSHYYHHTYAHVAGETVPWIVNKSMKDTSYKNKHLAISKACELHESVEPFGLVVLDESHKIKDDTAKTFNRLLHVESLRRVALTATSMSVGIKDLWAQLHWVKPFKFTSKKAFTKEYDAIRDIRDLGDNPTIEEIAENERIKAFWMAKMREDVYPHFVSVEDHPDLPHVEEIYVRVQVSKVVEEEYVKVLLNGNPIKMVGMREIHVPNPLAEYMLARQFIEIPNRYFPDFYSDDDMYGEYNEFILWIEDYIINNPDKKVIIAAPFKSTSRYVQWKLGHLGIKHARDLTKEELVRTPRVVGVIDHIGESLDFDQHDTIICLPTNKPNLFKQLKGRIRRIISENKEKEMFILVAEFSRMGRGIPSIHDIVLWGLHGHINETELVSKFNEQRLAFVKEHGRLK